MTDEKTYFYLPVRSVFIGLHRLRRGHKPVIKSNQMARFGSYQLRKHHKRTENRIWHDPRYQPNALVYAAVCVAFDRPVSEAALEEKVRENRKAFSDACHT